MICKVHPCAMLIGMINTDLVAVSHESGSHQLDRVLLSMITVGIHDRQQRRGGAACSA